MLMPKHIIVFSTMAVYCVEHRELGGCLAVAVPGTELR